MLGVGKPTRETESGSELREFSVLGTCELKGVKRAEISVLPIVIGNWGKIKSVTDLWG